jgi:hypothetical protein
LPQAALIRIRVAAAAFLAEYRPKLEREANKSGPVRDAELLRELVTHHFNLVAREFMEVCGSVDEFDTELHSDIACIVHYCLSQYQWLGDRMRKELEAGFALFVMRARPWSEITEDERASAGHVGAIIAPALSDAALRLRVQAREHAAEGEFPRAIQTRTTELNGNGAGRRVAVDAYIEEVFTRTGNRITRTDIWKSARYKSRTEFERWERNDLEHPNKTANQRFAKILAEKPHLK